VQTACISGHYAIQGHKIITRVVVKLSLLTRDATLNALYEYHYKPLLPKLDSSGYIFVPDSIIVALTTLTQFGFKSYCNQ